MPGTTTVPKGKYSSKVDNSGQWRWNATEKPPLGSVAPKGARDWGPLVSGQYLARLCIYRAAGKKYNQV